MFPDKTVYMQHYCGLVTDRNHQQEIQKTNLKSLI